MSIFLLNRDPEPNETGLPVSTDVFLEVVDDTGNDIDLSATKVYITTNDGPEVLAFDAGIFQPGFNGTGSTSYSPAVGIRRIRIDFTGDLDSLMTVTVRVVSASDALTPDTLDTSYEFTTEDLTPPRLLSATALGLRTVRLAFDEAMGSSALTATNYTFEPLDVPGIDADGSSVALVSDSEYDVTTDYDLSPGRQYRVIVSGVSDALGNAIVAPFDRQLFYAYEPPEPANREFVLYELLPQMNRNEDVTEDLSKFCACLQEVTDLLLWDIDRWPDTLLDPDTAEEQYVDAMLADLGNPFAFANSLSLTDKRRLIRVLVDIYRQKGTCVGIQNIVRFFLGVDVECDEYLGGDGWILGEGELGGTSGAPVPAPLEDEEGTCILGPGTSWLRYAFRLTCDEVLTQTQRDQITDLVEFMKPAHTHFVEIEEPEAPPAEPDHVELGLSELGYNWLLH